MSDAYKVVHEIKWSTFSFRRSSCKKPI